MHRGTLHEDVASRFAGLALACLRREFPNHPVTLMLDATDVRRPREQTPAFFGCFDWHSAVHGHWTLVRLLRAFPNAEWAHEAREALRESLTRENLALELRFLSKPGREGFERPYGLAWLLQLAAELREWNDADASEFRDAIAPLETHCRDRLAEWLPKLTHPLRSGEHSQTAFAMGLALDWSAIACDRAFAELVRARSLAFYGDDVDLPLGFEPSGHDFLSPTLAEADLLRRVLPREEFATWFDRALPHGVSLSPVVSSDRADGKLAHLDGLNLSRAWMLEGVASALDPGDERRSRLLDLAASHAEAGLCSVTGEHYAGGHWLGTFATYLLTRGIARGVV
ncbi:MAG: DUF2891 domain-containing protein [Planctomycetota bacterium]|nr:DUF2891 domain-containing protein [Planctomycetaceae bacterium]MDQ3329487.1 DUF2891 domain-containing protein [Planctomycetota bacterium]